jgi:hypothetical protein
MKTKRGLYQQGALLLSALTLGAALTACKLGRSSDDQQPEVVPTDPGQASIGAVTRYTGMEAADTGQASVRQPITARRAADTTSSIIATLQPGTVVNRLARYGNFSLVSWAGLGSAQQGWVDTNLAFGAPAAVVTPPRPPVDAGTAFGSIGTPTATAPPTQTPPVATTTAPPPPPPPPTATTTVRRPGTVLKPRH